ncbi:hypothetical protein K8R33_01700 [archaeon]|nr:hypothetical protein [archaeon]
MENQAIPRMNFEQFLRGSLNARSEKAPKSLAEAVQDPNLSHGMKLFHGGTLKHRVDPLDAASEGIVLGSADESFSIPITEEQENQIGTYVQQFYEGRGYNLYKKDTSGLDDSYFFRNGDSTEAMVVTCTLPMYNDRDALLVSASKVDLRRA